MKRFLSRLAANSAGRTLAELMVALAVSSMMVMIIASTQIQALRWAREDRHTATLNQPLREATSTLTRDVEFAASTDVVSGELVLTRDRINADGIKVQDTVRYSIVNGTLIRRETTAEGTTTERTLTSGLDTFVPEKTATGLVKVEFTASSFGSDIQSRALVLEILPRSEVGQ